MTYHDIKDNLHVVIEELRTKYAERDICWLMINLSVHTGGQTTLFHALFSPQSTSSLQFNDSKKNDMGYIKRSVQIK